MMVVPGVAQDARTLPQCHLQGTPTGPWHRSCSDGEAGTGWGGFSIIRSSFSGDLGKAQRCHVTQEAPCRRWVKSV